MKRPRPRFWTSSAGFRRLVLGPPLAFGGSFLDLLWLPGHRSWTSSIASGAFFFWILFLISFGFRAWFLDLLWLPGARFWTSSGLRTRFWTSSGFRTLVFGPPLASMALVCARFWTSFGFRGPVFSSFVFGLPLASGASFLFWTSSGFRRLVFYQTTPYLLA